MALQEPIEHYTVRDYLTWPDDRRCELIDGVIYDMTPAPTVAHQRVVGHLYMALGTVLGDSRSGGGEGHCEVLISPIDVVLAEDSVVQPDLVVVCEPERLANGRYVDGPPDLVVEVLSPSTALKDRREKRRLYERSRVAEYLILDPVERYAEHYRLGTAGRYGVATLLGPGDALDLSIAPGWSETLSALLGWPVPGPDESPAAGEEA